MPACSGKRRDIKSNMILNGARATSSPRGADGAHRRAIAWGRDCLRTLLGPPRRQPPRTKAWLKSRTTNPRRPGERARARARRHGSVSGGQAVDERSRARARAPSAVTRTALVRWRAPMEPNSEDIQTNWDEAIETFDAMDLRKDLLRGIYAWASA